MTASAGTGFDFEARDREQLERLGIPIEEALRQVEILRHPPPSIRLERPCRLGDGIVSLGHDETERALAAYDRARPAGRLCKFVPASGAASRMFQSLLAVRAAAGPLDRAALARRGEAGDRAAAEVLRFADGLDRFAFYDELRGVLAQRGLDAAATRRGDLRPLLDALLSSEGLDYATLPKGLLAFHRYPHGSRTAFEEHLVEAAELVADRSGFCRLHLTVSPEHRPGFEALLERTRPGLERRCGVRFAVGFSEQKSSTDTLALDAEGRPFRTEDGRLLLRPGGHGALIENLSDLEGDVVQLQNIDNVVPDHLRAETTHWRRVLTGHLVVLEEAAHRHRRSVREARGVRAALDEAQAFVARTFGRMAPAALGGDAGARREWLLDVLARPLRVCGMVRNTGEPGGGPFWVREAAGELTLQIVESAQVDPRSAAQREIFASATHFNPVQIVGAVRDAEGRPFDLRRFVDPAAVFLSEKSKDGRALWALERPGLWNGAMARWNTVFVEIPEICFTPVKTVNDLLRPEHQPA